MFEPKGKQLNKIESRKAKELQTRLKVPEDILKTTSIQLCSKQLTTIIRFRLHKCIKLTMKRKGRGGDEFGIFIGLKNFMWIFDYKE